MLSVYLPTMRLLERRWILLLHSNPLMAVSTTVGDAHECEGARRLATMNSRGELKRRKRKRENVMSLMLRMWDNINQRNKRFNEKSSRNYDEHMAEIR
jgi:hypothetical protein